MNLYKIRFLVCCQNPKEVVINKITNYLIVENQPELKLATFEEKAHQYLEEIAVEISESKNKG